MEEQLALAEALISGERYEPIRRVWATSSDGERVHIERSKRVRPWYWINAAGRFFSVYYGSKLLKLDGQMTAVSLTERSELPDAIKAIIEAVRAGELDLAIEEVAEKGIPDVSLRGASKGIDRGYK